MKTPAFLRWLVVLASSAALTLASQAQDPSTQTPAADQTVVAPATTPSSADEQTAPATPAAPAAAAETEAPPSAPAAEAAPAPETTSDAAQSEDAPEPELRRLDVPENDQRSSGESPKEAHGETPSAPSAPAASSTDTGESQRPHRHRRDGQSERVSVWNDSSLAAGEYANAVVSVFGSSTSHGEVGDAVVSVFGSSTSSGPVGGAVVSVFGNSTVPDGEVGDAVVSVLGTSHVNVRVHGDVVAVMGDVILGPKADVRGNIVCVGGTVQRDPGAAVHGHVNNIALGFRVGSFDGLHAWVSRCLVLGRPLAFGAHLMWAWWIAIAFLALYLVFALLFPRGITKCVETFERRPGYSILTAFLVTLITPAAAVLLAITIIGTPALLVCLFVAVLFGKAVMLAWIGRRITLRLPPGPMTHPAFAVLIGGIIVLLLYTIPIVGFILAKVLSWLGLGAVIYAFLQAMKRPKPAIAPVAVATASSGVVVGGVAASAAGVATTVDPVTGLPVAVVTPPPVPAIISAVALPRAGFWLRIAASLLDVLFVAIVMKLVPFHRLPDWMAPHFVVLVAIYCFAFWALRATTLGGVVCGLKIVRLDDRPVDWMTALVRALGGFLSLFAAGLGFIWVAFDDQKQSWHDKIAGTTIVRVPRGISLI